MFNCINLLSYSKYMIMNSFWLSIIIVVFLIACFNINRLSNLMGIDTATLFSFLVGILFILIGVMNCLS